MTQLIMRPHLMRMQAQELQQLDSRAVAPDSPMHNQPTTVAHGVWTGKKDMPVVHQRKSHQCTGGPCNNPNPVPHTWGDKGNEELQVAAKDGPCSRLRRRRRPPQEPPKEGGGDSRGGQNPGIGGGGAPLCLLLALAMVVAAETPWIAILTGTITPTTWMRTLTRKSLKTYPMSKRERPKRPGLKEERTW